jgi:hypothetical protein
VEFVTSTIVKTTILIITLVIFLIALHNSYIKNFNKKNLQMFLLKVVI